MSDKVINHFLLAKHNIMYFYLSKPIHLFQIDVRKYKADMMSAVFSLIF